MEAHYVNMELKYQNQALKDRQHGQILNETSNKAKFNKEIEVLEKINIELEHSVAKLPPDNEKKTIENAYLKALIQEKVFANVALKNELRKLKGNSVDTKFAKPSILGKTVLQPPRNQSVVRQPNAFKSERPNFSKPRFASQVDVNNVLNSSKNMPRFSSNDMVHNYYLEEAKKKTQERDRKSTTSVMPSAKSQNTTKSCKSKPRSNNQISRCVFNANHDACITKLLKEVNSLAKIQPNKTRNSNKPVDPTSHTQKPGRKIVTGHSFSPNKSSTVHEKINTPRSYLRWILTGRIFNTVGLKWVPTGKTFTSSTTKVDCELPNGSNDYITNPYKCDQTLNVSAGTLNSSAGQWLLITSDLHPCFMIMASVDNTSGPKVEATLKSAWTEKDQIDNFLKKKVNEELRKFVGGRLYEGDLRLRQKNHMILSLIFNTTAGNPVKKILLKLNLSDHRILKDGGEVKEFQRSFCHSDTERLSRSDEVLKLKNFKKDATLKLSKSTNQEWYEHVGPEVTSYTRWQDSLR
ncbi:hypothetical protein Tco_0031708 [Tanacetum coccineum]